MHVRRYHAGDSVSLWNQKLVPNWRVCLDDSETYSKYVNRVGKSFSLFHFILEWFLLFFLVGGFQVVEVDHADGWNNLKILLNGMSKILAECGTRTTVEVIQCLGLFTNVCIPFVNCLICFYFFDSIVLYSFSFSSLQTEIGHHCLCSEQPVSLICEEIVPYLKDPSHEVWFYICLPFYKLFFHRKFFLLFIVKMLVTNNFTCFFVD